MLEDSPDIWAAAEFGTAKLGNTLRTRRAVRIAAACARHPAGKVTAVFVTPSEREGAFRFLENDHTSSDELMRAAHGAAARRCGDASFAYVPLDKTSLTMPGVRGARDFGMVSSSENAAHGVQVMSALAVTPDGIPQGVVAQTYWARPFKKKTEKRISRKRPVTATETQRWLDALQATNATFAEHAPLTRPWYQVDREGDATPLLMWAVQNDVWFTVRAAWDRRLAGDNEDRAYLWPNVETHQSLGAYTFDVGEGNARRTAIMEVRACRVDLSVPYPRNSRKKSARKTLTLHAVLASERSHDDDRLEWMLLTTRAVDTFETALEVVVGYTQRWRIEEFHKIWKTGACRVEDSQLRNSENLIRWAVVLASVAARLVRITYRARVHGDLPADVEFTAAEIRATLLLRKPRAIPGKVTISDVVTWIAQIGGYSSPAASGGPPGALVLARGLERMQLVAATLAELGET